MERPVKTQTRIDVPRKIIGCRDDRLERGPDEGVAMRLAAGQGTGIAAKKGEMRLQFVTERHSLRLLYNLGTYGVEARSNASPLAEANLHAKRAHRIPGPVSQGWNGF